MHNVDFLQNGHRLVYGFNEFTADELHSSVKLTKEEETYIEGVKAESRKREWLYVRYLLQQIEPDFTIAYLPSGKPILKNSNENIAITHTKGFAAVLLGESKLIGLDAERVSGKLQRVAHKFAGESFVDTTNLDQLCLVWCAKEAMFKAYGDGELDFRKHLSVKAFVAATEGDFAAQLHKNALQHSFRLNYKRIDDVYMVWLYEQ